MQRRDPSQRRRASEYDVERQSRRGESYRHHDRDSRRSPSRERPSTTTRHGRSSARSSAVNSRATSARRSDRPSDVARRSSLDDSSSRRPSYPGFSTSHSREAADGREVKTSRISYAGYDVPNFVSKGRTASGRRRTSLSDESDSQLVVDVETRSRKSRSKRSGIDSGSNTSAPRSRGSSGQGAASSRPGPATGPDHLAPRSKRSSKQSKDLMDQRPPRTLADSVATAMAEYRTSSHASRDQARSPQLTRTAFGGLPHSLQPGSPQATQSATARLPPQPLQSSRRPSIQRPAWAQAISANAQSPSETPAGGNQFAEQLYDQLDALDPSPRVDYLLQNGGLPYRIPLSFTTSHDQHVNETSHSSPVAAPIDAARLFMPISNRLDDIDAVLSRNGSLAVATGYRSVARRLLDRLEHVFMRDISSQRCSCVICGRDSGRHASDQEVTGLSWGEILELVSGRRRLPQWPPFALQSTDVPAPYSDDLGAPMQRVDPDVPAQYRDHYLQQNDKTKRSVNKWLHAQHIEPSDPPNDVDDETLSFAMLTRLSNNQRYLFATIMNRRNQTGAAAQEGDAQDVLGKTAVALQRLYRLPTLPRDPECTMFLLNNSDLHGMLVTLAEVSPAEWDILTSGRFDGFLWSGAEGGSASRRGTSSQPTSHNGSSAIYSSNTPSGVRPPLTLDTHAPAPVQLDEETEINTLIEMDHEILEGMEELETQFEAMHQRAEQLRRKLQIRAQGLNQASRSRLPSLAGGPGVGVMSAPARGNSHGYPSPGLAGPDDMASVFDDGRSELAPDDSASNIHVVTRPAMSLQPQQQGSSYQQQARARPGYPPAAQMKQMPIMQGQPLQPSQPDPTAQLRAQRLPLNTTAAAVAPGLIPARSPMSTTPLHTPTSATRRFDMSGNALGPVMGTTTTDNHNSNFNTKHNTNIHDNAQMIPPASGTGNGNYGSGAVGSGDGTATQTSALRKASNGIKSGWRRKR